MGNTAPKKDEDLGQAEVQKAVDTAEEQGYLGTKVDPLPNSAHSLASGPDAPPLHETDTRIDIADAGKEA